MKKLLLFTLLCVLCCSAKALSVHNTTACSVTIHAVCYNTGCTNVVSCSSTITVMPNQTVTLPTCNCGGNQLGYIVCCGANCVGVNDGGTVYCPQFPISNSLSCFADCPTITLTWNLGTLTIS